ncbi:hypothetical protein BF49_4639 [Bradyrhizobium sp.]|nr:hypothetical protein BF49_4639 [Bradyrhizobium sp.]
MDRGEKLFGWARGALEYLDNAEMPREIAEVIEDRLAAELRARADALSANADEAAAVAEAFERGSRERRTALELVAIGNYEDLVDKLLEISMPGRGAT